jgi:hypothetical protein
MVQSPAAVSERNFVRMAMLTEDSFVKTDCQFRKITMQSLYEKQFHKLVDAIIATIITANL